MKTLYLFIVISCFHIKNHAQNNPLKLSENLDTPVMIEGILEDKEWLSAKEVTINNIADIQVSVLLQYDTANLYIAFKNLTDSKNIRFNAEVLINTQVENISWNDHCFWFHSSYANCSAIGKYYAWEDCSTQPLGWIANTFPFKNGNNNIEFKISFSKLNITPVKGQQLKIAFKISNPLEQHAYWPDESHIDNPLTWGRIEF